MGQSDQLAQFIGQLSLAHQRLFARWCAWQVAHLWDAPEAVRRYLLEGREEDRRASWFASWGLPSRSEAAEAARGAASWVIDSDNPTSAARVATRAAALACEGRPVLYENAWGAARAAQLAQAQRLLAYQVACAGEAAAPRGLEVWIDEVQEGRRTASPPPPEVLRFERTQEVTSLIREDIDPLGPLLP